MTPLLGRYMDKATTPYHLAGANAYLNGFSAAGRALAASMSSKDMEDYYDFFLLLRAVYGAKTAQSDKFTKLIVHGFKDCHLRCTYCIADMSKPTSGVLDVATVRELAQRHTFTAVHFIGGEPTYNWDHLFKVLDELPFVRDVSLTTNGLGLAQRHIDALYARCPDVAFHISVEPEAWGQRIFENGTHQNVALRKVFAKIDPETVFRNRASCVNLVMPVGYGDQPFHTDMDVNAIVDEISAVLNYDAWIGSWQLEGVLEGNIERELPGWAERLISTEVDYLLAEPRSRHRFMQGPLGMRVARMGAALQTTGYPGTFFICTVGSNTMHLAHNGDAFSCSIEASRGEGGVHASAMSFKSAAKWLGVCAVLPALANDVCRKCPARFVCGRTCGQPARALCEGTRLRADYTPQLMERYEPAMFGAFAAAQERVLSTFMAGRAILSPVLHSREARDILAGRTTDLAAVRGAIEALGGLVK